MSKIIKVEVWGGFHRTMRVLRLNLKKDDKHPGGVLISKGQRAKISAHICSFSDCMCGLRDIEVSGVEAGEFSYAMSAICGQ